MALFVIEIGPNLKAVLLHYGPLLIGLAGGLLGGYALSVYERIAQRRSGKGKSNG